MDGSTPAPAEPEAEIAALRVELQRLREALGALPEAVAVFDEAGRFVFWNAPFERLYGSPHHPIRVGLTFDEHIRNATAFGEVAAAIGREDEWVAERLARFADAAGAVDHQLTNGRWVRVQDRLLPGGGRIGIRADITELIESARTARLLFDDNPMPMFLADRETLGMVGVNHAAIGFYGYGRDDFLRLSLPDICPASSTGDLDEIVEPQGAPEAGGTARVHVTASGEERMVRVQGRTIDFLGRPTIIAAVFDTTEQLAMEQEIRRSRAFLHDVLDHIPTAVFVKDMHDGGRYVLRNKASAELFGRSSDVVVGKADRDVFDGERARWIEQRDRDVTLGGVAAAIDDDQIEGPQGESKLVRVTKVGFSPQPDATLRYVIGIAEDVTDQRASEARIAFMAHHDALTELPNRFLFRDRLETALARLPGTEQMLAVMLIDLDGFKAINDTWGHGTGDNLLKAVAERLQATIRPSDTAARLGGDEFAVLVAPMDNSGEAAWLATRLLGQLSTPFVLDGRELQLGASIGIAVAPLGGSDPAILLEQADAALYRSKHEGRNRFRFADPGLNTHAVDRRTTSG